jgi:hypothetical protein
VRTVLKWLAIVLGSLVLLCVLLGGLVLLVNLRDEPLSAGARALLTPPANPYPSAQNIYLAMMGYDAPAGESPTTAGARLVEQFNANLEGMLRDQSAGRLRPQPPDPHALAFRGELGFIVAQAGSVLSQASAHRAQITQLLRDNAELYQRYRALPGLRGYYETVRPSWLAPARGPNILHRLFLADVAVRAGDPASSAQAQADLAADLRLWHAVLTGEGGILSKMLAVAYLQEDELLIADLLAEPRLPFTAAAEDVAPLYPLADWDIGSAIAFEFRTAAALLRYTEEVGLHGGYAPGQGLMARLRDRLGAHLFKVQATENLFAAAAAVRIRAAATPGLGPAAQSAPPPLSLYNPVGRLLAYVAQPGGTDQYVLRAWDGAAFQRLLRLGFEIRRRAVPAADIPAFLGAHPEWSRHPLDGRPFLWDPARGELAVQTLAQYSSPRRFAIRIWQPAG